MVKVIAVKLCFTLVLVLVSLLTLIHKVHTWMMKVDIIFIPCAVMMLVCSGLVHGLIRHKNVKWKLCSVALVANQMLLIALCLSVTWLFAS